MNPLLRDATLPNNRHRDSQAEAIVSEMRGAAGAERGEFVTRGELYRALWIQAAALIGAQIAIAGFVVHLLSQ